MLSEYEKKVFLNYEFFKFLNFFIFQKYFDKAAREMDEYKKKFKIWEDEMILKGKLELVSTKRLNKFEVDFNYHSEFLNDGLLESSMYNL